MIPSVRITNIIMILLVLCNGTVTTGIVAIPIINLIFYLISFLLGLYVFWHMIHKLLEWVVGRENNRKLRITHWVFLVIFWFLVLADYAVVIATAVTYTTSTYAMVPAAIMTATGALITAVVSIVFFVASLEILGWTIFISTKADSENKVCTSLLHYYHTYTQENKLTSFHSLLSCLLSSQSSFSLLPCALTSSSKSPTTSQWCLLLGI